MLIIRGVNFFRPDRVDHHEAVGVSPTTCRRRPSGSDGRVEVKIEVNENS